jgi:uncharacterized membrane protein YciS (DUF1049 family)
MPVTFMTGIGADSEYHVTSTSLPTLNELGLVLNSLLFQLMHTIYIRLLNS